MGPDLDSSNADLVKVHNIFNHAVIFIFSELTEGAPKQYGDRRRFVTGVRINPAYSDGEVDTLLSDTAELANWRGRIDKVLIWTSSGYDKSEDYMGLLRKHQLRFTGRPFIEYYHPQLGVDGVFPLLEFTAVQYTQGSYWEFSSMRIGDPYRTVSDPLRDPDAAWLQLVN